jgi:hypothetical protein
MMRLVHGSSTRRILRLFLACAGFAALSVACKKRSFNADEIRPSAATKNVTSISQPQGLDVNDVSILFALDDGPLARQVLLPLSAQNLMDGEPIFHPNMWKDLLSAAQGDSDTGAEGLNVWVKGYSNPTGNDDLSIYRVTGMRFDPCVNDKDVEKITSDGDMIAKGSYPNPLTGQPETRQRCKLQLRLIAQPIRLGMGAQDTTLHLVYGFPAAGQDRVDLARQMAEELLALKGEAPKQTTTNYTPLTAHPGLVAELNASNRPFTRAVKDFILKYASYKSIEAVAFMGLNAENLRFFKDQIWNFLAFVPLDADPTRLSPALRLHEGTDESGAKVLAFKRHMRPDDSEESLKGRSIEPVPLPGRLSAVGLMTAGSEALDAANVNGIVARYKVDPKPFVDGNRIENPRLAAFTDTDCVSCHQATAKKAQLLAAGFASAAAADEDFAAKLAVDTYSVPAGITGDFLLSENVQGLSGLGGPPGTWIVRNFGHQGSTPQISLRTAHESADVADLSNRVLLKGKSAPSPRSAKCDASAVRACLDGKGGFACWKKNGCTP